MENKKNLLSKEKTIKQNRIWVRISSACNNKCIFCLDEKAQYGIFIDDNIIKNKIKEGYKKGFENRVIISGGEASINPKFLEYIKYAKRIGYNRVQTVTNGNMFFSEIFCDRVFKAGLDEVTFSFHGHNSLLHDYLVDTPGSFKKSLKGLIYIKKNYPKIIINIDIVVNKINVKFLPDIVKFFIKLGVYEFDILQIIPFGKGFNKNKSKLFYNINDNIKYLHNTWKLSRIDGMYMWTNRFPVEAFEGYEDLIQDPRKIKAEVMGEFYPMFKKFISSKGNIKPKCYGNACKLCFIKQYCHDYINNCNNYINNCNNTGINIKNSSDKLIINGEYFPSEIYEKYGVSKEKFLYFLNNKIKEGYKIYNIPECLGGTGLYQKYNDLNPEYNIIDYNEKYIKDLYKKKSLRCKKCLYNSKCEGIHINFIRSYGFSILQPIIK